MENTNTVNQQTLKVGQKIHCILYGGMNGYIKEIRGEQSPGTCQIIGGGVGVTGGRADIIVRFKNGHESHVPESIVRGSVQWKIFDVMSPEEVADYDKQYFEAIADKERKAAIKKANDEKETAELIAKYGGTLVRASKDMRSDKAAIINIRYELKTNYPGIKFSVTHSRGSAIDIHWTDGPTSEDVEKITGKYHDHKTDESGDFRDYNPSNFTNLFGGENFIFSHRERGADFSGALIETVSKELEKDIKFFNCSGAENFLYRIWNKTSLPAGAKITGVESIEGKQAGGHSPADWFRLIYEAPELAQVPEPVKPTEAPEFKAGEVNIIEYGKGLAVVGDTRPIKDKLKELGGRFNPRLTVGCGWVFPKTKLSELETALS